MPRATEADIASAAAPQRGMATEGDVLPEQSFGAGAAEFGHQWGGFFEGLWNKAKGAVSALLPDDPSKAAVNAPIRVLAGAASALHNHIDNLNALRDKAEESLSKGNIADFLGHLQTMSVEGLLPGVGQAADAAKAKWDSGDKVGAAADAAALTSQMLLGAKAGDLAKAGLNAAAYTTAAARAGGPGVLGGLAKAGVGEVLAKVPGMELPARFGLQYPALRDVSKALAKGAEAGRAAIAPEVAAPASATPRPRPASAAPRSAAPPAEAPTPAAGKPTGTAADMMNAEYGPSAPAAPAPVQKSPGQALYESDARPTDVPWERVPKDQQAMFEQFAARPTSAAGAPPPSPTPSAARAQPASAAPTVLQPNGGPLRPPLAPQPAATPSVVSAPSAETTPNVVTPQPDLDWSVFQGDEPPVKPGLTKDAYKGAARGTRADRAGSLANILGAAGTAADDLNSMSLKQWQDLAAAHDIDLPTTKAAQSKLFFDTKMALRQREIDRAGTGGTIKPLPGFSMGEMKNYRAQPATAAPSAVPSAAPADIDFQQRYGEQEQPEVAKFLGHDQPIAKEPWQMTKAEAKEDIRKTSHEIIVKANQTGEPANWQGFWHGFGGRGWLTEPHLKAIRWALANGKSVPPEVLADYPELVP